MTAPTTAPDDGRKIRDLPQPRVAPSIARRVRRAIYWRRGHPTNESVNGFLERAIEAEVARLETEHGGAFAPIPGEDV